VGAGGCRVFFLFSVFHPVAVVIYYNKKIQDTEMINRIDGSETGELKRGSEGRLKIKQ